MKYLDIVIAFRAHPLWYSVNRSCLVCFLIPSDENIPVSSLTFGASAPDRRPAATASKMQALLRHSKGPTSLLARLGERLEPTSSSDMGVDALTVATGTLTESTESNTIAGSTCVCDQRWSGENIHGKHTISFFSGDSTSYGVTADTDFTGSGGDGGRVDGMSSCPYFLTRPQQQALFGRKASPTTHARAGRFTPRQDLAGTVG